MEYNMPEGSTVIYKRLKLRAKTKNIQYKGISVGEFNSISRLLFSEIVNKLIETGENMWMPQGELAIRMIEQKRAYHIGFFGENKEKRTVPILDDYFPKVLWLNKHYKVYPRGCKVMFNRANKKKLKEKWRSVGDDFYKRNAKLD